MRASNHPSEERRLAALREYGILDTPLEKDFDGLVALASKICEAPMSTVTLVDAERQWFKAEVRMGVQETSRSSSICAHAILEDDLVEIPDLTLDARFADNPFVHAGPELRFYAGAVLKTPEGLPLGTLCVLDTKPRRLTEFQREALRTLGAQVVAQLELRRAVAALQEANESLEARVGVRTAELAEAVEQAEGFNYSISHDLRAPLRAMVSTSSILLEELGPELGGVHRELLERQAHNAGRLGRLIDELLHLSRFARVEVKRRPLDMTRKAASIFADLEVHGRTNGCRFEAQAGMAASGDPDLVRTVLQNLLDNACKFSPKGGTIRMRQAGEVFSVADEGVGFDMKHAHRMFRPFERLVSDADFEGTGIGLANVKRIVERHGGRVWTESEPGRGATFLFRLGPEAAASSSL